MSGSTLSHGTPAKRSELYVLPLPLLPLLISPFLAQPVSKPPYTNVHRAKFLDEMLRHLPESVQVHFGARLSFIENFTEPPSATEKGDDRTDTQGKKRTEGVRLHIEKPSRDAHPDYPAEPTVFECDICIGCDVSPSPCPSLLRH
jgi:hypothetical protein